MTPTSRQGQKEQFLRANAWGDADTFAIPGDASFRSYTRLVKGHTRAILMDAPPSQEDVKPFAALSLFLNSQGFRAPEILAHDVDRGFLLLEDFGDARFSTILRDDPGQEENLYQAAVKGLVKLTQTPIPRAIPGLNDQPYAIGLYNTDMLYKEAALFIDWTFPLLTGCDAEETLHKSYKDAWYTVFAILEDRLKTRPTLVLRDYHVDNLMLLKNTEIGLLDFQDALIGDPAYDLVSLLQDARRDIAPSLETTFFKQFIHACAIEDIADFKNAYAILGAQRSIKIIGIFTRLWKRDNKPHYLDHLPRLWRYVEHNFNAPILKPVKTWFDTYVPEKLRTIDPRKHAA